MEARKIVSMIMYLALALYIIWCSCILMQNDRELLTRGKIDEFGTNFRDIDSINNNINPILMNLTTKNFFRRFKVSLKAKCPFWTLIEICGNPKSCEVCVCEERDIPFNWKEEDEKLYIRGKISSNSEDCYHKKTRGKRTQDWMIGKEGSFTDVYVDLIKNIESYTGYQGQKIWHAIYGDHCLRDDLCLKKRLLQRAISGMHTSISTHISQYYEDFEIKYSYANTEMYFERVGGHPERIKNLYFAFGILIRGLNIAADFLNVYNFSTGFFLEDISTHKLTADLLITSAKYGDLPYGSFLFKGNSKCALKVQLKDCFHKLIRIMDCIDCEKCKTYGKMQIQGLRTAFKLIFDEHYRLKVSLSRSEIIALVITIEKWSKSIKIIRIMLNKESFLRYEGIKISSFLFILLIFVSKIMLLAHHTVVTKFKKKIKSK